MLVFIVNYSSLDLYRWRLKITVLIPFASMNVSIPSVNQDQNTVCIVVVFCTVLDPGYEAGDNGGGFGGAQLLLILLVWLLIAIVLFGFR